MIHVERNHAAPPNLLEAGAAEQTKAHEAWTKYLAAVEKAKAAGTKLPKRPKQSFSQYKSVPVKELLIELFHGKCAYCESFYSSTQPMDVEHFRPKGAVADEDDHSGYYWLAATWENLLPSCIDCNRKRNQDDVVVGETISLGKKDRFPIGGTRARTPEDSLPRERARLIDPTIDDPDHLLRFDTELGIVVPRAGGGVNRSRALHSIEVYGLNRSGLVTDRLHVLRLIDHHLEVIRLLTTVRNELDDKDLDRLRDIVDEVIGLEIQAILDMRDPSRPYSGMARQVIAELAPDIEADGG